jgi:hypothetical protein
MVTLVFDGKMGASGDMIIGALLSAGANVEVLNPIEEKLGVKYDIKELVEQGILAKQVRVTRGGKDIEGENSGKKFEEIIKVIRSLSISEEVVSNAVEVFRVLGEAEAEVHGKKLEEVNLHEVGADDAIADIVGACMLIEDLDVESIVVTPISVGGGTIKMKHGEYPVPVPAVLVLARNATWSIRGGPVEKELLTPTGAAILLHFARGVERIPALNVMKTGYGMGHHKIEGMANVLRVISGEMKNLEKDEIVLLETNIDDVSPEVIGNLYDVLLEEGARDVTVIPAMMKKSRPGHIVKVMVKPENADRVAQRLAEETGTLGIRESPGLHRWIATRKMEQISVEIGGKAYVIAVKIASGKEGKVYNISAEYEDSVRVARETNWPVRRIIGLVEEKARGKWME